MPEQSRIRCDGSVAHRQILGRCIPPIEDDATSPPAICQTTAGIGRHCLAAGGAGSRGAPRARNGHTTALFAYECQSFLDNVIAGLGQTGAWNDPRGCWFRGRSRA